VKANKRSKHKQETGGRNKLEYGTGQLLSFARDSYLERTSRPIYAIFFLLPFIIFYEVGTFAINTDVLNHSQVRVVAFVWLQHLLEYLGTGSRVAWVAPPFVVILILVGLQLTSGKPWSFSAVDVLPMAAECVVLAIPLIVFSLFLNTPSGGGVGVQASVVELSKLEVAVGTTGPLLANIVTGIGAGIYEELVFRLILICVLMMLFQDVLRFSHRSSIILSVVVSAALFSAHHHVVLLDGEIGRTAVFNWREFGFRTVAGVYFAGLFAIRGFGITAGTHAFYDILATVINAVFFGPSGS